ncbi:MAG: Uma2 family endonuclease [Trebonia sp.]
MLMMNPESDIMKARFLLEDFLSVDTPKGYRVELINGEIVVTPPPSGNHDRAIWRIVSQIVRNSDVEMDFSGTRGLIVPSGGIADAERVIPDGTFAPTRLDLFREAGSWMPASDVAMVLEVTSSRPGLDREDKRRAYAGADIPLYLLVDREERRVILFSAPVRDDYSRTSGVSFGEKLELPKPFGFTLDTVPFAD